MIPSCRHIGVPTANEVHAGKGNKKGTICIDCYREQDRERHRRYRTGASPASLKTANHPKAAKKPVAPAVQVALDILRDARAPVPTQGWVYLVIEDIPGGGFSQAKIGWTSKNPPEARLSDYQAGNPRKLRMIAKMPGTKADEGALHKKYADNNVLGEWFTVTPGMLLEFSAVNDAAA